METKVKRPDEVKKHIVDFATRGVEKFLRENPQLEFYAFAFDCNVEYAGIGLCLNTEPEFQQTLKRYQEGAHAKYYQTEEDIKDLKYNTGDWEYPCFETMDVFTDAELTEIFGALPDDDYKSWNEFVHELLELFTQSLVEFTKTETYRRIPKTKDFIAFCIDHDEDFADAMERLGRHQLG